MKKLIILISCIAIVLNSYSQIVSEPISSIKNSSDEFSFALLGDSILVFTSTRGLRSSLANFGENRNYESIWVSYKRDSSWSKPESKNIFINDGDWAVVGASNNKYVVLYNGALGEGDLYLSEFKGNSLSRPKKVFLHGDYSYESSGYFDVKGGWFYFTSDREGGKGGLDVWRCEIDEKFRCKNFENLEKLNTEKDEHSIFISGDTLWFASNHSGDYDICFSILNYGYIVDERLSYDSLNTSDDELFYNSKGFFCSNRETDYDIWKIKEVKKVEEEKIDSSETSISVSDSMAIEDSLKFVGIDLDTTIIQNLQDIRDSLGYEFDYFQVQLITYRRDGPNCVPPKEFKNRWGIKGYYEVNCANRVVDGQFSVAYILSKRFYDFDETGLEKCVEYKREFISKYPAFDYLDFKPFINAYTFTGERYLIYYDYENRFYYIKTID